MLISDFIKQFSSRQDRVWLLPEPWEPQIKALEGAEILKNSRGSTGRLGREASGFPPAFESRTLDKPAKKPYWLKRLLEWSRTFFVNKGVLDTSCWFCKLESLLRSAICAAKSRASSVCAIAFGAASAGIGALGFWVVDAREPSNWEPWDGFWKVDTGAGGAAVRVDGNSAEGTEADGIEVPVACVPGAREVILWKAENEAAGAWAAVDGAGENTEAETGVVEKTPLPPAPLFKFTCLARKVCGLGPSSSEESGVEPLFLGLIIGESNAKLKSGLLSSGFGRFSAMLGWFVV
jgi:hypothetical protein